MTLRKIQSLSQRIRMVDNWHWGRFQRPAQYDPNSLACNTLEFLTPPSELHEGESAEVLLSIDGSNPTPANFVRKGRRRGSLPAGSLSLTDQRNSNTSVHIIPESDERNESSLTNKERIQGEAFNYSVARCLSGTTLASTIRDFRIATPTNQAETITCLVVEDFSYLGGFDQPHHLTGNWNIRAQEMLNLEVLEAIIANRDFAFEYNDFGRLSMHNVAVLQAENETFFLPYDFQFTAVLTPEFHKYHNFSLEEEAVHRAHSLARIVWRIPDQGAACYVKGTIQLALNHIEEFGLRGQLGCRFKNYLSTLQKTFVNLT